MQTTALNPAMSLDELHKLDISISRLLDASNPSEDLEGATSLLRKRRWVRDEIGRRKAASTN